MIPNQTTSRADVEDAINEARYQHDQATMQKMFEKGLRMFKAQKKISLPLKRAVIAYNKFKEKQKKEAEMKRTRQHVTALIRKEMKDAFTSSKAKMAEEYGKQAVATVRVDIFNKFSSRARSQSSRGLKRHKRRIARALGWTEIDA